MSQILSKSKTKTTTKRRVDPLRRPPRWCPQLVGAAVVVARKVELAAGAVKRLPYEVVVGAVWVEVGVDLGSSGAR